MVNEVRKLLAVGFGEAICEAVGSLHHLDTNAVAAFAMAWITLQLQDAKINGLLRGVDSEVTQVRKVSTPVDLLAPGVLQALGVSRVVISAVADKVRSLVRGLRPWDVPAVDTFFSTWQACVLEAVSSSFVLSLGTQLAPICDGIRSSHLNVLRCLAPDGALRLGTWALEDGALPHKVHRRAFTVARGMALVRLVGAIKGASQVVLLSSLLLSPTFRRSTPSSSEFEKVFDAQFLEAGLDGVQAGAPSGPRAGAAPAGGGASWTTDGLNSVVFADAPQTQCLLAAFGAEAQGKCTRGSLFPGACTRDGCTYDHSGGMLPDATRQRIFEAGGALPR